jgi:hypothetical protein
MRLESQLEHRGLERGEHGKIAAAGTPVGMDAASVRILRELTGLFGGDGWFGCCAHRLGYLLSVICYSEELTY